MKLSLHTHRPVLMALLYLAAVPALAQTPAAGAATCSVRAAGAPRAVVELYTSEGCSSCPPADRWLSTLKASPDLLALGFHVSYWDRLGWPDRFASAEITARQQLLARNAGRAQVYTPQVVVNGDDWRRWPQLPCAAARTPARRCATTMWCACTGPCRPGPPHRDCAPSRQ